MAALGGCVVAAGIYVRWFGNSPGQWVVAGTLVVVGVGAISAAVGSVISAGGRGRARPDHDPAVGPVARMLSHNEDERAVRRLWHYYYLAAEPGGSVWRYRAYDFGPDGAPGFIALEVAEETAGGSYSCVAEVAIRGGMMILVETRASGNGPPVVVVTPRFGNRHRRAAAGVIFQRSWDGGELLSKCLWSRTSLVSAPSVKLTSPEGAFLAATWNGSFSDTTIFNRTVPSIALPRPAAA